MPKGKGYGKGTKMHGTGVRANPGQNPQAYPHGRQDISYKGK